MRILLYQRLGAGLLVLFFFGPSWQLIISAANRSPDEQGGGGILDTERLPAWLEIPGAIPWLSRGQTKWCCCSGQCGPGASMHLHVPQAHSRELQQSSSHWKLNSSSVFTAHWGHQGDSSPPCRHTWSPLGYGIQGNLDVRPS